MKEEHFKNIAEQLRQPKGEFAVEIGAKMNESNAQMNLYTIDHLKIKHNDSILEIGMGNGFFVKNLFNLEKDISYVGCDFSEIMVREAQKLNSELIKKGRAQFINANADNLPFEDNRFNKIFTINTVYFWNDVTIVLQEFKRVLKNKGYLSIAIRPKSILDNFPISKYGFKTFSKLEIKKVLEENGFSVEEIIEKKENDLEFFGEILENSFVIINSVKI